MLHAQTSTVAGAEGDEKDGGGSARSEGTGVGADEPFIFPASSSSALDDDDFGLGEFDAEAQAIAQQVRRHKLVHLGLCTKFLSLG